MSSTIIAVRVIPNASHTRCDGQVEGTYRIRLQERAENGRANKALVVFLANQLGIKRREISWVSGEKARQKLLRIESLSKDEIAAGLLPT
mgnify:CR=1 FL=1